MRVYIISPYPTVRAGLTALAREQPGWVVAGASAPAALGATQGAAGGLARESAGSGAAEQVEALDIALVELEPGFESETVAGWLETLHPRSGLVALGAADVASGRGAPGRTPRQTVELARLVLADGLGFGALPRDAGAEEIVAAVTAVASGLSALDRRLALEALSGLARGRLEAAEPVSGVEEPLTAREREVLQLLAQGIPNKQIAQRLSISEHTVKFHVSAIMTKLGAASRTEAVTTAARRGLLLL